MKTIIIVKNKQDLKNIITHEIELNGHNCDLNHIDVSLITDMNSLFSHSKFNGDISGWDVSNVKDMAHMFMKADFNKDISNWNISHVKDMEAMFEDSNFNGNISMWKVSNVENMNYMFAESQFNGDLSNWQPINLEEDEDIFYECNAPIPYWVNYHEQEQRKKAINSYCLNKELQIFLPNKPKSIKKIKI
jgi:hypothetical protein